jgi:hypothetical protein
VGHAADSKIHEQNPDGICPNVPKFKVFLLAADTPSMSSFSISSSPVGLSGAIYSGHAAIATSTQQLNQDAQQIANPYSENTINPLVDESQSLLIADAAANVIRTSNQMLGTLLDAFA